MDFLSEVFSLFIKGGLVMYPLLFCSVLVVAITVERWFYYNKNEENTAELLQKIKNALQNKQERNKIQAICEASTGPVAAMIAAGLNYPGYNRSLMKDAMEEEALHQIGQLKVRLNYLDTIVTLSPLLGLLGTVIGMINSCSVLSVSSGQPFAITAGVAEALIATGTGLAIAIMALFAHSYLTARVDYVISGMEKSASRFLNFLPWEGETK
ncbi:MAG: MotA/TolQ/ExbB proton channel family protein [Sporomusaceae bacterium]|jgi:biopolymer transport protein ExbB|nr:MotA/TolQ/ExbB proton channel family protein [Sporomusaceae bacterium]